MTRDKIYSCEGKQNQTKVRVSVVHLGKVTFLYALLPPVSCSPPVKSHHIIIYLYGKSPFFRCFVLFFYSLINITYRTIRKIFAHHVHHSYKRVRYFVVCLCRCSVFLFDFHTENSFLSLFLLFMMFAHVTRCIFTSLCVSNFFA